MERHQTRKVERKEFTATVGLAWESERGDMNYQQVKAHDLSPEGVSVYMLQRMEPRSRVTVIQNDTGIRMNAVVRHCSRRGTRFLVGLEFASTLKGA